MNYFTYCTDDLNLNINFDLFFFRITIDKYERNTLLTVRRAVRSDSGKYTLILKNSSGTAEKDAEVIVLGIFIFYLFHPALISK